MTLYAGGCHCGRIKARFETELDPAAIEVRADQCGFCRRHGAKTISDPAGRLTLSFAEADVRRHRFGQRTADFLICRTCGHYIAAAIDDGFAVLNVVGADIQPFAGRAAVPVDYDDETPGGRTERRRARWTPVAWEIAA